MATLTATGAQAAVQPKGLRVGLVAVKSTFSLTTSLSAGDVIQMVKVPAGATPMFIQYGLAGTGAHTILELGDGIVAGRYRSLATYSAGLGMIVSSILVAPYTYSTDDTIDFVVSMSTAGTAAGAFYLNAIFSMDPGT